MNHLIYPGLFLRIAYRAALWGRCLGRKSVCYSFGRPAIQTSESIEKIYVINLDRQTLRWTRMQRELRQISDRSQRPLEELTTRIPATDARTHAAPIGDAVIEPRYTLGDQLRVEPQPAISKGWIDFRQPIYMTREEIAVAHSHVEAWKRIATNRENYALVLEDDVFFRRGFAQFADQAWGDVRAGNDCSPLFDIFYLSYQEVKGGAEKIDVTDFVFRPFRGLWNLSGYVLSRSGAQKLLTLLPVRGPVDLWINHQFDKLKVYASSKPLISQRLDSGSDNSYSVLPVLAKVGVLEDEAPIRYKRKQLIKPVFAFGTQGTGLTSLAMALSMLGYRCCSDVSKLPTDEFDDLIGVKQRRVFDAYVNVGGLEDVCDVITTAYSSARFIVTANSKDELDEAEREAINGGTVGGSNGAALHKISRLVQQLRHCGCNFLVVPLDASDKWRLICEFLDCYPPSSEYPALPDQGQRRTQADSTRCGVDHFPRGRRLKFDASPWIAPLNRNWVGVQTDERNAEEVTVIGERMARGRFSSLEDASWIRRDDTFPSNLALFKPSNVSSYDDCAAILTLQRERSGVRGYSAAAISSRRSYLYGGFEAVIRPSNVPGVVTGMFLHRNSPRQEIDIEFLGKDTTKLLLNVYYNPGDEGARFEYGYRGTPVLIALGFDASDAFHRYRMEWSPAAIQWSVDGKLIHKRANWEPTPIPHLPMQFHVNLWPSRSVKLAGRLSDGELPTVSAIKSIELEPRIVEEMESKRGIATPKSEIDLVRDRLKAAERHHEATDGSKGTR